MGVAIALRDDLRLKLIRGDRAHGEDITEHLRVAIAVLETLVAVPDRVRQRHEENERLMSLHGASAMPDQVDSEPLW